MAHPAKESTAERTAAIGPPHTPANFNHPLSLRQIPSKPNTSPRAPSPYRHPHPTLAAEEEPAPRGTARDAVTTMEQKIAPPPPLRRVYSGTKRTHALPRSLPPASAPAASPQPENSHSLSHFA